MFPIVHNVNQLIASVNALKCDVHRLKAAREASLDEDGNPIAPAPVAPVAAAPEPADLAQVRQEIADVGRSVSEMKRYVDAIKVDIERGVSMTETTVLRKCEVALNRMVQDKIAVALDKERGQIQDRISDAVEEELEARSRRSPFADPRLQQRVQEEIAAADEAPAAAAVAAAPQNPPENAQNDGGDDTTYEVKLKGPNRKRNSGGAAHSRVKKLTSQ
jgi:hypothetical protein